MDLNMPKMDGLEVLAALRERQVDIPVILTTFYGSEQVAQQAFQLGAVDYIVKPYDILEMMNAVQKALARRPRPMAPDEKDDAVEEPMPITRQVERWMRDMNILTRVGKVLVAELDMGRVCTRAVEAAVYVARADYAFLFWVEPEGDAPPRLMAKRGPGDRHARFLAEPVESDLVLQVAESGRILVRAQSPGETALAKIAGKALGPLAAAPLRWRRKTLGVLIATRDPGALTFNEADLDWIGGLADYAAIAVQNAQAYESHTWPAPVPTDEKSQTLRQELAELATELEQAQKTIARMALLLYGQSEDQG
jgi:hypothetical protein